MSKIEYLHHDGARIGYRDDGKGRPIVLIHGTGGDGEANFAGLMPYLSDRRVIRPDYAGSGLTDDPTEVLSLDRLVDQVLAAVAHAGAGTFDLLGFSLGAAVATRLAAQRAARSTTLQAEIRSEIQKTNSLIHDLEMWHQIRNKKKKRQFL